MNEQENILMTVSELQEYLRISKSKAWQIVHNPNNKFVVHVGKRVFIHKELLDKELLKNAKYGLSLN